MELAACPDCGCHVYAGSECPFCSDESSSRRTRKIVVGVIAGAITLGSFGCAYGMPDDKCETGGTCTDARTDTAVTDTATTDTGSSTDSTATDSTMDADDGG
jgi:hypothetical protein